MGCEMCGAPHLENTKFIYVFKEQIKLCLDCYKSWNQFYHNHKDYRFFVEDEIREKIWAEWVYFREGALKREKVSFT
jgi:ribosome-binding protein aMBF1 (putative translation factor)